MMKVLIQSDQLGIEIEARLPATMREIFEFQVFACAHVESNPERFQRLAAQWLQQYIEVNAEMLEELQPEQLGHLCELVCLSASAPPTFQQSLLDRFLHLYGVDTERERDDSTGAFDGTHPWVSRAAGLAFAIGEDGPAVLEMPPWAWKVRMLQREAQALRSADRREDEEAARQTEIIGAKLGLKPAP